MPKRGHANLFTKTDVSGLPKFWLGRFWYPINPDINREDTQASKIQIK